MSAHVRAISEFLDRTNLRPRQAHKALTLWPLVARTAPGPAGEGIAYVALGDALEDGFVGVEELSQSGEVPRIRVQNRAASALLVLFGEELRGAKQNRVANASFLVPAQREVVIDVSCVEAGRWGGRRSFESSADVVSHAMRRKMAVKVGRSRSVSAAFDADQTEVWDQVEARLAGSGTASDTGAWADYTRSRAVDLDEIGRAFRPLDGQVGFVAAIGDEVVGVEAIGRPEVFARAFPKLVHSYAIDAIDSEVLRREESGPLRFDAPEPFLAALREASVSSTGPSLGLGEDLRLLSGAVEGCALAVGDTLIHLTAFPRA